MTPSEFLSRVTSAELTELIADALIEPSGDERADWHAAMIACAMGGGKVKDYLLKFTDPGYADRERQREAIQGAAQARSLKRVAERKRKQREEDGQHANV